MVTPTIGVNSSTRDAAQSATSTKAVAMASCKTKTTKDRRMARPHASAVPMRTVYTAPGDSRSTLLSGSSSGAN